MKILTNVEKSISDSTLMNYGVNIKQGAYKGMWKLKDWYMFVSCNE